MLKYCCKIWKFQKTLSKKSNQFVQIWEFPINFCYTTKFQTQFSSEIQSKLHANFSPISASNWLVNKTARWIAEKFIKLGSLIETVKFNRIQIEILRTRIRIRIFRYTKYLKTKILQNFQLPKLFKFFLIYQFLISLAHKMSKIV